MGSTARTAQERDTAAIGEELARRLLELASIRSVSRNEREIADFLEQRLRALPHLSLQRVGENLIVTLAGAAARPQLLFCGHLDTVPENENLPPRREGDLVHGLGTSDLKSGLAVLWLLLEELADPAARAKLADAPAFVF